MILLIDNYDSFSYNLYQLIGSINPDIMVVRNDELTTEEIENIAPEFIILSPGPGRPIDAGVTIDVVNQMKGKAKILGVCLGHQAICEAFGATVSYAKELMHGKESVIDIDNSKDVFKSLPSEITVARYHSLAVIQNTVPNCLEVIAKTTYGEIMAVQHKKYDIVGLQFHPESIMTPTGKTIISNFLGVD